MAKNPIVRERKLGKEKALGQMDYTDNIIEIDPRQDSKSYMNTIIHEKIHHLAPSWGETKVEWWANRLAAFLWEQDYRKVKL